MILEIFGVAFWLFAVIFIGIRSRSETKNVLRTAIKMIPALLAAVFILLSGWSLFYLLLAGALIFCGLGDAGMEVDILPGLGLFLISHFIYTGNFMLHGLVAATVESLVGFAVCIMVLLIYLIFYFRYVKTAEVPMPDALLRAAYFYAIMISLTTSSSLLLWFATETIYGFLPFIGALLFVASDSMIVVKRFHHEFKFDETLILITYYAGIFLLSLGAIIFTL